MVKRCKMCLSWVEGTTFRLGCEEPLRSLSGINWYALHFQSLTPYHACHFLHNKVTFVVKFETKKKILLLSVFFKPRRTTNSKVWVQNFFFFEKLVKKKNDALTSVFCRGPVNNILGTFHKVFSRVSKHKNKDLDLWLKGAKYSSDMLKRRKAFPLERTILFINLNWWELTSN